MDVLYVLGKGSKHKDQELCWSLRSLERYGINVGNVYIVGECPIWVNKKVVTHIPCNDPYNRKCKNIWHKVLYAIDHCEIGNEFLLSADDIFHIKPIDIDNYPYYHKNGKEVGSSESANDTPIAEILNETRSLLQKYKYPLEDYGGGHCLHHVNVSILRRMPKITADVFSGNRGGAFDVIMGNAIVKLQNPITTPRTDIKLRVVNNEKDFYKQIGDAESFSVSDRVLDGFVGKWLRKEFRRKCKYEI
jgi:hypothetical protein